MAHEHLLCLDIETVPDRNLIPADWPETEFIRKPIWHKVVAISFVEARIEYPQSGASATWSSAAAPAARPPTTSGNSCTPTGATSPDGALGS